MDYIDLEPKTDREILMVIATTCNGMKDHLAQINGTLANHEKRIKSLETMPHCGVTKANWKSTLRDKWHVISLLVSIIALIAIELSRVPV